PAITSVSPKQGHVGTTVTIIGSHFSAIADSNTVTFNGTKAVISSSMATKLVVSVPKGATSGLVKVTTNGQTAAGPTFTVGGEHTGPQVTITNLAPKSGPVGSSVTIT